MKNIKNALSLNIDLDVILRYDYIVKQIKLLSSKNIPDRAILEVGGGCYGIAQFVDSKIVCCDLSFEATGEKALKNIISYEANAQNLPFGDNEFRFVVCVDMLEHVNKDKRRSIINELCRVSGEYVFLAIPIGEKTTFYEKKYNERYKKHYGFDNKWLKEHIDNGLPCREEIVNYFKLLKIDKNIKIIKQGNLMFWYFQRYMRDILGRGKLINSFFPVLRLMNFGSTYREIFVIKKLK